MSETEMTSRIDDAAALLRKLARYFSEAEPGQLTREDLDGASAKLGEMARGLEELTKGQRSRRLRVGLVAALLYLAAFGLLAWGFQQCSPFDDRYYVKLVQQVFDRTQGAEQWAGYIKLGVSVFAALASFFVALFLAIIPCSLVKLVQSRWMNAAIEAGVTAILCAGLFYVYHTMVFATGLAKSLL